MSGGFSLCTLQGLLERNLATLHCEYSRFWTALTSRPSHRDRMFRTIQEITLSSQLVNIDIFIRTTHIMFNCSIIMSCAAVGQLLLFFFVLKKPWQAKNCGLARAVKVFGGFVKQSHEPGQLASWLSNWNIYQSKISFSDTNLFFSGGMISLKNRASADNHNHQDYKS